MDIHGTPLPALGTAPAPPENGILPNNLNDEPLAATLRALHAAVRLPPPGRLPPQGQQDINSGGARPHGQPTPGLTRYHNTNAIAARTMSSPDQAIDLTETSTGTKRAIAEMTLLDDIVREVRTEAKERVKAKRAKKTGPLPRSSFTAKTLHDRALAATTSGPNAAMVYHGAPATCSIAKLLEDYLLRENRSPDEYMEHGNDYTFWARTTKMTASEFANYKVHLIDLTTPHFGADVPPTIPPGARLRLRPGEHTVASYRYFPSEPALNFQKPSVFLFFVAGPLPREFYILNLLRGLDDDQLYVLAKCGRRALNVIFNLGTIMASQ